MAHARVERSGTCEALASAFFLHKVSNDEHRLTHMTAERMRSWHSGVWGASKERNVVEFLLALPNGSVFGGLRRYDETRTISLQRGVKHQM